MSEPILYASMELDMTLYAHPFILPQTHLRRRASIAALEAIFGF